MKDTKIRANLVIDKDLKSELEKYAKAENRSFNNLVVTILQKYVEEKKKS